MSRQLIAGIVVGACYLGSILVSSPRYSGALLGTGFGLTVAGWWYA